MSSYLIPFTYLNHLLFFFFFFSFLRIWYSSTKVDVSWVDSSSCCQCAVLHGRWGTKEHYHSLSHLCQLVLCQSSQIMKNKSLLRMIIFSSLIHQANDLSVQHEGSDNSPWVLLLFFVFLFSSFFSFWIYISLYINLWSNWRVCTSVLTAAIAQITTIVEVNNSHTENEDRWAVRYQINLLSLILLCVSLSNFILSCRNLVFFLSHSLYY